jgi:hypothetical protein
MTTISCVHHMLLDRRGGLHFSGSLKGTKGDSWAVNVNVGPGKAGTYKPKASGIAIYGIPTRLQCSCVRRSSAVLTASEPPLYAGGR